jgi:hypothetical protein
VPLGPLERLLQALVSLLHELRRTAAARGGVAPWMPAAPPPMGCASFGVRPGMWSVFCAFLACDVDDAPLPSRGCRRSWIRHVAVGLRLVMRRTCHDGTSGCGSVCTNLIHELISHLRTKPANHRSPDRAKVSLPLQLVSFLLGLAYSRASRDAAAPCCGQWFRRLLTT